MKTTKYIRKNSIIAILFTLTAILLFPFIGNAQLNLNSTGGVSVGTSTVIPTTGLNVNSGGVLVSGGVSVGGGTVPSSGLLVNTGGAAISGGTVPSSGLLVNSGGVAISGGTVPSSGLLVNSGGASISGGTVPSTGLNVNAGDINLNSASDEYQIGGTRILWYKYSQGNTFLGFNGNTSLTTGIGNSFIGYSAGYSNTSGSQNTFVGRSAGSSTTSGGSISAFGYSALSSTTGGNNTAVGSDAGTGLTTGTYNSFLGNIAGVSTATLTNTTAIGYGATALASNKAYIGNASLLSVNLVAGATYSGSDGRFKINVKEEVKGLGFIMKLRPVTYNMDTKKLDDFLIQNMPDSIKVLHKNGMDFTSSTDVVHSGFIAQEVEQAGKDVGFTSSIVSVPTNSNDMYSLSYAEMVVPLVKSVQELNHMIENLTTVKTKQDSTIKAQNTKIGNLDSISNMQNEKIADLQNQISHCCSNSIIEKSLINNEGSSNIIAGSVNGSSTSATSITTPVLYQNVPNPFNQTTSIQYAIPTTTQSASIMVFDLTGKLIKTIPIATFGNAAISISGNELSPGMFVYSLIVDGKIVDTKHMVLTQ